MKLFVHIIENYKFNYILILGIELFYNYIYAEYIIIIHIYMKLLL